MQVLLQLCVQEREVTPGAFRRINSAMDSTSGQSVEDWRTNSLTTSSDTSQFSFSGSKSQTTSGQLSGQQLAGQQLAGQLSNEERQMSGDSVSSGQYSVKTSSSSLPPRVSIGSSTSGPPPLTSKKTAVAARGYQSKRKALHSRSKISVVESSESNVLSEVGEPLPKPEGSSSEASTATNISTAPPPDSNRQNGSLPIIRHHSVKESPQHSPHAPTPPERTKQRPLSAFEPSAIKSSRLGVPEPSSRHYNFSSVESPITMETPLYSTHVALTPSGEESYREVNIEEAIARSQGAGLLPSQDHAQASFDDHLLNNPRTKRLFTRNVRDHTSFGF